MMSGTLSKRQQARNERALQDLIKSVPGNSVCADCSARNPGWASWSLGIFLCMRCAALHRKMGTHITKVKSLSMDSWSNDQVENMKRVGNIASNRIYNPNNAKPPIPFDADEADSAMERFIRGKYQERAAAARHDTGRSSNSDDNPPPLPPKTGSKFGFRSASSIFPLSSSKNRRDPPPPVDTLPRRRSPSPDYHRREYKPAPTAKVGTGPLDLAGKMTRLRDMGFADPKRNLAVLNGLGGNLEKTIDTLVRLGEGNGNKAGDSSSSRGSRTPNTPAFPLSPGLAVNRSRPTPEPKSTNPFDLLDIPPPAQPQSSQSTGSKVTLQNQPAGNNPFLSPSMNTNPFGLTPSQSQYSLNQAFQNMAVSNAQPPQPLFPNHTGGVPVPQQQTPYQHMYQQSAAPSIPVVPTRYATLPAQGQPQGDFPPSHNNPFMQQQFQQTPNVNTNFQNNPYTQSPVYQSPVDSPPQQQFPSSSFPQGYPQQSATTQQNYTQQLSQGAQGNAPMQFSNSPFDQGNQQQQQQNQQQFASSLFDSAPQQQQQNQQQFASSLFDSAPQQQQSQPQQLQQNYPSSVFDQGPPQQTPQQPQQQPQQHYNPFFAQGNTQQQAAQQAYSFPSQQVQYQQQMNQQAFQMQPQQPMKADNRSIMDLFNQPQMAPARPQQENQPAQEQAQAQAYSAPQQQPNSANSLQMQGSRNPFQTAAPAAYQGGNPMLNNMAHLAPAQQPNGSRHVSQESMSIDAGGWQNGRHSPDAWGTISARSAR